MMGLIGRIVPVADEKNNLSWGRVARDFAHNVTFSLLVSPFINGMSHAINHNGFWKGVKEASNSWRGWKCNAELALGVGFIATTVNLLLGRSTVKAESPPPNPQAATAAPAPEVRADHAMREESRREQAADARISR